MTAASSSRAPKGEQRYPRQPDGSFAGVPPPDDASVVLELNVNQVRFLLAERASGDANHPEFSNASVLALGAKDLDAALGGGLFLGWRQDLGPEGVRVSRLAKHRSPRFVFALAKDAVVDIPTAGWPAKLLGSGGAADGAGRVDLSAPIVTAAQREAAERAVAAAEVQDGYLTLRDLAVLPAGIGAKQGARNLSLHGCPLHALPAELASLRELKVLDASATALSTFPEVLCSFTRLERLSLASTPLGELPEHLSRLSALQELDLSFTRIERLPEGLCALTALRTLNLGWTRVKELPAGLAGLRSLRTLRLNDTPLETLPETLTQLPALETLELYGTPLTRLPEWLPRLHALRELLLPVAIEAVQRAELAAALPWCRVH